MPVETRKRRAMAQEALGTAEPASSARAGAAPKRQRKLPLRSKDDAPELDPETEAPRAASQRSGVITFDDDGNADQDLVIPAEPVEAADPSQLGVGGDSDGDEAPEVVSTSKLAVEMKKSARAEKKASREQAAAEKKRRQQRDALFKQQASERRVEKQPGDVPETQRQASGGKRPGKVAIPTVLPAEFLTDSESEADHDTESSAGEEERPRRRTVPAIEKRMSRDARGPRDEVIGTTVYRVSSKVDQRLAPKVKRYSKGSRDVLLKRGRAPVKGRSGFFKK
ncbi:uncharacterized protein MAM_02296 [Metarhizium album ARSEF 1941]|uniref:U3 snoRNA associated n=1 Tax=Metarhizium album (strain ARSEF 1941) TaxID=1081103 RepID=A0A0B2WZH1_METAS|nr:uncharacterized protein MAM_02296 [Metarhizium album ARSEF 1941]KHN99443.1 hypothetical protein MAM_02296 [Metarhizium album ARSEF 1941]